VKKGTQSNKITKPFPIQIKTKLKGLVEAETKIVEELAKDPTQLSFNTLSGVGFDVDVIIYDNKTAIFSLTDETTTIEGYNLTYIFASEVTQ
jgi:hypothetical protein